jgi:hypothetical protein
MRGIAIAIGLLAVLFGAACGGGGGGDDQTFDTGDGEVTLSEDLPGEFPDDFPIYEGADLQGSTRAEQDGIDGIVATWTSGDDFDDVTAFYADEFEGGPWISSTQGSAGGSTYWSVEHDDGKVGYVTVSGGEDVTIMAVVGDDPDQAASDSDSSSDDDASSGDNTDDGSGDASSDDDSSTNDDGSSGDDGGSSDTNADLPDEVALPDGFPTDTVSFPDGVRITTGTSYSANGQTTYMVGFFTEDSAQEVADYYKSELEGDGYTQSIQTSDATGSYAAYSENADGSGKIIVVSVNDNGSYEGYREGVVQVTATE